MEDALQNKVTRRMKELRLPLAAAAKACDLDYATFLSVRYGRTKRPGPDVLLGLSKGLGFSYAELALAAYGIENPSVSEVLVGSGTI